ncbi:MAG: hypothetical protein AB9856_00115 [Cellulosilyticaceae bacterium]
MNEFANALISKKRSDRIPEEFDYFGQFVGEWEFEWIDNHRTDKERHIKGEWIFSWILEGTAIQDIFICPSRAEKLVNPQDDAEYGTTVRIYNSKKQVWDIFYGCNGETTLLEATRKNDTIVLTCLNINRENYKMKWVFSEITETSFHWRNIFSIDAGNTWNVCGELFAIRKK